MPYFPLWSAVAISQYGLSRDSNAPIENYFKILKHNILDGETRIPAPRFITKNLEIIQARLKERQFPLTTSRQKRQIEKVIPDDEETAVETWQKQKKQTINRFLKYPKYVPVDNNANVNVQNDEPKVLCEDDGSPEPFEKCKPSRCVTDVATADEVLFDKEMTYPQGFPDIKKVINGFVIEPQSFRTLMPFQSNDEYLDDNVINAFFSFLPGIAERKKFSLLCFDTYICESILRQGFVSDGFHKWASTIAMVKYPVWLIPIHYANHWTLLMIVHPRKIIVLYDSLHRNPNEKIVGDLSFHRGAHKH